MSSAICIQISLSRRCCASFEGPTSRASCLKTSLIIAGVILICAAFSLIACPASRAPPLECDLVAIDHGRLNLTSLRCSFSFFRFDLVVDSDCNLLHIVLCSPSL